MCLRKIPLDAWKAIADFLEAKDTEAFMRATFPLGIPELIRYFSARKDANGLLYAVQHNRMRLLNYILREEVDFNIQDLQGRTPLLIAVEENNLEAVEALLLLESNVDVNAKDLDQRTPLHEAIYWKYINIVRALLRSKDINLHIVDIDGSPVLHQAIKCGSPHITQLLVSSSELSDFLIHDSSGYTPLYYLLEMGYDGIVSTFISQDQQHPSMDHLMARELLSSAVSFGRESIALQILHIERFQAILTAEGGEELFLDASRQGLVVLVEYLIQYCDIDRHATIDGINALQHATRSGSMAMIRLLLKFNINPRGYKPLLEVVARNGCYEIFQQLCSHESYKNGTVCTRVLRAAVEGGNHVLIDSTIKMLTSADYDWQHRLTIQSVYLKNCLHLSFEQGSRCFGKRQQRVQKPDKMPRGRGRKYNQ